MRNKLLGNSIVKKAIVWAMAGMMTFTSVGGSLTGLTVYAEGEVEQDQDQGSDNGENDTSSPEEKVDTDQATKDAIDDAEESVGDAIHSEEEARAVAVLTIGDGIITDETLAVIADAEAKKDLQAAEGAIAEGEQKIGENIDDMNSAIEDLNTAKENAANAATEASEEQKKAEEALDKALNTTNQAEAEEAVDEAKAAADEAQAKADIAKEEAEKAQTAFNDAKAAYEAALKAQEEAEAAATEAVKNGLADAQEAEKKATEAKAKAVALKDEMDAKEAEWRQIEASRKAALEQAAADLTKATADLAQATKDAAIADAAVVTTGTALGAANVAVEAAKGLEALAAANVEAKEAALEELRNAIVEADAALEAAKAELATLEGNKEEAEKALEAAQKALDEAIAAKNEAEADLVVKNNDAEQKKQEADKVKAETETEYGQKITSLEKEIKDASDAGDDELVSQKTTDLYKEVLNHECGTDENKVKDVTEKDGIFEVTFEDDSKKYYKVEDVTEEGAKVYEYSQQPVKGAEKEGKDTKSESELASIVGEEGIDWEKTLKTEGYQADQEALYSGTYTIEAVDKTSVRTPWKHDWYATIGWYIDNGYTVTHYAAWKDREVKRDNIGYYYELAGARVYSDVWLISGFTMDVQKSTSTTKEYTNMTQAEIDALKANVGVSITDKECVREEDKSYHEAEYEITYYERAYDYSRIDDNSRGSYENLSNKLDKANSAYEEAKGAAETAKSNADTKYQDWVSAEDAKNVAAKTEADAKAAFEAQKAKVDQMQKEHDEYFGKHVVILGHDTGKHDPLELTQYKKDLLAAQWELEQARNAYNIAVIARKAAEETQKVAKAAHEKALKEAYEANVAWGKAVVEEAKALGKFVVKGAEYAEAVKAHEDYVIASKYAEELVNKAEIARKDAEIAREKIEDLLKKGITVGSKELAEAEKALEEAEKALEAAEEEATNAQNAADAAEDAYLAAIDRLEVVVEINRASQSSGGGAGRTRSVAAGDVLGAKREDLAVVSEEGDVLGATRAPKTSDSAKAILWMLVMGCSAIGAAAVMAQRKKEEM